MIHNGGVKGEPFMVHLTMVPLMGYACINTVLTAEGVSINRTARMGTVKTKGVDEFLVPLARRNLQDMVTILEWNDEHDIKMFRMSSVTLPHISNKQLIANTKSYRTLLYKIEQFMPELCKIAEFRDKGHRLTFHPDPYLVLNAKDKKIFKECLRELHWHAHFLDLLDKCNGRYVGASVIVMHGGGVYDDKVASMKRWINRYCKLPEHIRRRVVLENDEHRYSIDDTVAMHIEVKQRGFQLPLVLDWFHFECYYGHEYDGRHLQTILDSWEGVGSCKMHISNQQEGGRFGSHSDYITRIPELLPQVLKDHHIDLMVEAKMKEQATLMLKATMQGEP